MGSHWVTPGKESLKKVQVGALHVKVFSWSVLSPAQIALDETPKHWRTYRVDRHMLPEN